ncbi:hypothetical protein BKA25_000141 [Actinoalloteichus hymeniacidonis]|nr:hypothetical protein [Actinoalloteichus hymeniacidonis]
MDHLIRVAILEVAMALVLLVLAALGAWYTALQIYWLVR